MRRFVVVLLCVEFLDELWDGVSTAAWPLVCADLGLSYQEVGLLLGVPVVLGNALEPWIGVVSEGWGRRRVALGGGVCVGLALALGAVAQGFWGLMVALTLFYPASGALVGLSELDLVEQEGAHRSRWMMVWVAAGSLGALVGPLWLLGALELGGTWRAAVWGVALLAFGSVALLWWTPTGAAQGGQGEEDRVRPTLAESWRAVGGALGERRVWRASGLLMVADLMMDIWVSFWVLFAFEVRGLEEAEVAVGVSVFLGGYLVGSGALARWLPEGRGGWWLRWSAVAAAVVGWGLIGARGVGWSYALLGSLGGLVAGWYPILKARFYGLFPGQGGVAMAVHSVGSAAAGVQSIVAGWVASRWGLTAAMLALTAGAVLIACAPVESEEGE
jgi:MFS transporter, FSR family, fosmidomycin resistance protein